MKFGKTSIKTLDYADYGDVKDRNIGYYDSHSQEYYDMSQNFAMESLYQPFLEKANIQQGAKILDAGCGSGRDSLNFAKKGFDVTAFDGSHNLVELCKEQGINCEHKDFLSMNYKNEFDAVWCCAALLHLPTDAFDKALSNITDAMKPGATLYFSIKQLENGFMEDGAGRLFYNPGETHINALFEKLGLELQDEPWLTGKQTEPSQMFINYLVKKQ